MRISARWPHLLQVALVLCSDAAILLLPPGDLRAAASFTLLWVLPGWAWGLRGRWLLGLGLGIAVNALLALLLHYLPGPIPFTASLAVFSLSALLPMFLPRPAPRPCFRFSISWALPLLIALVFRLPDLGYSEFQGDEALAMVRAAKAAEGDDGQLYLHQKGPVEILLPLATWRLAGAIDEFWARLPFAWVSLLGIAAIAQLGTRWFGRRAGCLAGLIMAVNGFHTAFGRIVQYQSIVVGMGLLALLALDEYREHGHARDLLLGAALLAVGALAHYDTALVLPAALPLALRWTPGKPWRLQDRAPVLAYGSAILLGLAIVALFYVPFVLHPNFAKTLGMVGGGRVGGGLYWNVGKAWDMSTLYCSTYYVILLLVLAPASLLLRPWPRYLPLAWLLFAVPLAFYLFFVLDPRTHIYTACPGLALLAAAFATAVWERLRRPGWRWGLLAAGAGWYALCAGYNWLLFVSHTPEYERTWPTHKSALYWTTYDALPLHGRFGFPHRAGWHAIAGLISEGQIAGILASNEEPEITAWYTRQSPRTRCSRPDVYIIAQNLQDEVKVNCDELDREYQLAGTVRVEGEPRISWYTRRAGQAMEVDAAGYHQWWRPEELLPRVSGWTHTVGQTLGGTVQLLGYDLESDQARPGGWIQVTLYWRPLVPLSRNYQVFTHLYDGRLWAQHDGAPQCASNPTTFWEPGQVILDAHLLSIPADAPTGPMPLLVGMYDLITEERLSVPGAADAAVHLTDVEIQHAPR